jgi:hypothetical protein
MKSFERDGKFSRYDAKGNDNPAWKGKSILELLQAVLLEAETTESQKERATDILAYVTRKRKWFPLTHPELDAYEGILRIDAGALWDFYPRWEIVTDKDGVERVTSIESADLTTPTAKVQGLEPEVEPEPVEIEPTVPMTAAQKNAAAIAAAREQTRGLIPSLNF